MTTLVQKTAPDFTAQAVMSDGSFEEVQLSNYRGKYVVHFFTLWTLLSFVRKKLSHSQIVTTSLRSEVCNYLEFPLIAITLTWHGATPHDAKAASGTFATR